MCDNVEHPGGAAHRVVLTDLRAVLHRHVPAAEVDDAGAQLLVQLEKRGLSSQSSSKQKAAGAITVAKAPAALLSCDLRDQALQRRSPSVGGLRIHRSSQKPRGGLQFRRLPFLCLSVSGRNLRLRRSGSRRLSPNRLIRAYV